MPDWTWRKNERVDLLLHPTFQVFFSQITAFSVIVLVLLQALQVGSHEMLAFACWHMCQLSESGFRLHHTHLHGPEGMILCLESVRDIRQVLSQAWKATPGLAWRRDGKVCEIGWLSKRHDQKKASSTRYG